MMKHHFINQKAMTRFLTMLLLFSIALSQIALAQSISQDDVNSIYGDTVWYEPGVGQASISCSTTSSSVTADQNQTAIIKIIIGIAKTDNLGKAGALVGLMAADAESGYKIYANSSVPVSLRIPHQAVGSNYDSVGVFQQRPSTGWSTIATGSAADSNRAAVAQLMDPAYSAEAFFGSPYGSKAPDALSKGLQDINWKSLSPAEAATTVQGNQGGAATYASFQSDAESFINQYWDSSPAVPLPIPLSAATGTSTDSGAVCSGSSALGTYKNPLRSVKQLRPERIDMGVDYGGEGPVHALGDGVIKNLTNSGWNYGGYDAFISEQLSDGPAKGLYVYVAEACVPVSNLKVGDKVNADTVICNMINPADSGIETGWAAPPGNGAAMAGSVYFEGATTAFGINYNQLLVSLKAPSGIKESDAVVGTLPNGWPRWK
jgi:murein DD-endopeptidase MepM/ murein hydrolase activator NlpD